MTYPDPPGRFTASSTTGRLAVLVALLFAAGIGVAWSYLSMRSVMAVGTCADGGPYVSAQHCPPGSGWAGIAIPLLVLAAILGTFVAGSMSAPNLLVPLWLVIGAGLSGKFFANAFASTEVDPGYLVLGLVFGLLAVPAAAIIALWWRRSALLTGSPGQSGALTWVLVYSVSGAAGALVGAVTFLAWT